LKCKIGFLTIGQSPRPDVIGEIRPLLGRKASVVEAGALDSLSMAEMAALGPAAGDFPLITRLRDGHSIVVSRKKIVHLLQERVKALERAGADVLALLCTEEFSELVSSKILLQPARILRRFVSSVLDRGSLFVVVPLPEQKEATAKKWGNQGFSVKVGTLVPYGKRIVLVVALREMKEASPDAIVLDCIGYRLALKGKIQRAIKRPVFSAREALVAALRMIA